MKNFWLKLKIMLGLVRKISPEVDAKLREAEELGRKAEQAAAVKRDRWVDGVGWRYCKCGHDTRCCWWGAGWGPGRKSRPLPTRDAAIRAGLIGLAEREEGR